MKILVLAGGLSPERNVSLSSGAMVCEALRNRGHQAAMMDLFYGLDGALNGNNLYVAPIPESYKRVAREAPDLEAVRARRGNQDPSAVGQGVFEMCKDADIVYLALHGACGEDGRIQAALDLLGVPYTGSGCLGSAVAMDKDMTKRLVAGKVKTPRWETVTVTEENVEELAGRIKPPVVVKPIASGSSIGVYIAKNKAELLTALAENAKLGGRTVIEEYIQGREIQVAVLDGRALPSIEIIPKTGFYDYANKYQPGAAHEVCPARIPDNWEKALGEAALTVFETIGLSVYARADFIVTPDGTPYFLEINTLPGMTPTSLVPQEAAAAGIDYGKLCDTIIQKSLEARKEGR
ncbi:D-alanine--D-alanine ligase [Colidextribacter sp. OB.20]|uniref:D-alanine--D-alanine ligase n=1 Tax=Colidextribacter sp. OB.20 TaxID=2304568 RepID=UPI0013681D91|nr:D-alanine--D-alanine ligase [Colidextribacter sp. OB.20]NBI09412.1 D-alanine--D-alanine ligase [Colidextribacter sp. OB.20]